jgi:hypothetical protein
MSLFAQLPASFAISVKTVAHRAWGGDQRSLMHVAREWQSASRALAGGFVLPVIAEDPRFLAPVYEQRDKRGIALVAVATW